MIPEDWPLAVSQAPNVGNVNLTPMTVTDQGSGKRHSELSEESPVFVNRLPVRVDKILHDMGSKGRRPRKITLTLPSPVEDPPNGGFGRGKT